MKRTEIYKGINAKMENRLDHKRYNRIMNWISHIFHETSSKNRMNIETGYRFLTIYKC